MYFTKNFWYHVWKLLFTILFQNQSVNKILLEYLVELRKYRVLIFPVGVRVSIIKIC